MEKIVFSEMEFENLKRENQKLKEKLAKFEYETIKKEFETETSLRYRLKGGYNKLSLRNYIEEERYLELCYYLDFEYCNKVIKQHSFEMLIKLVKDIYEEVLQEELEEEKLEEEENE